MKYYTLQDTAQLLGTDIETLRQWLTHAPLEIATNAHEHQQPVLNQQQVEALAHAHQIPLASTSLELLEQSLPRHSAPEGIRVDALHLSEVGHHHTLLLHDISLHIPHNAFLALVGGSGVGKSTLMYALSGLQPAPQGSVLYNGYDYYRHFAAFRMQLGYVPQDEIIHRRLSVHQALFYAARMRLPKDFTRQHINRRINEVLTAVGLSHRRHFMVGKLSGGERKRVSIALELLANPSIFFLDEPTSGLDPGLDYKMMHLLRELADKGHTIILVTHTIMNIEVCDYVCFLARGGRLTYYGPPAEAKTYFGTSNFAEIYARLEPTEETPHIPEEAEERFRHAPSYQRYVQAPLEEDPEEPVSQATPALSTPPTRQIASWRQFLLLSQRYLELLKNDTVTLLILLLQAPVIGLILWSLAGHGTFDPTSVTTCPTRANFLARTGPIVSIDCQRVVNLLNSPESAQIVQRLGESREAVFQNAILPGSGRNAQTLLFIMGFAVILFGCINGAREIVKEVPIYRRERLVNVGIAAYLFSKIVVLSIFALLQSALLVLFVNAKAPFQQGIFLPVLVEITITMVLTALVGLMLGLTISAMAPTTDRAMSFVPLLLIPQVIFSGMLFKLNTPFLQALGALFAMRWAMAGMGSSVGLHSDKVGVDAFAYQGTLFVSLHPDSGALHATLHLLLTWGVLLVMILALGGITAYFLKRKDVRR